MLEYLRLIRKYFELAKTSYSRTLITNRFLQIVDLLANNFINPKINPITLQKVIPLHCTLNLLFYFLSFQKTGNGRKHFHNLDSYPILSKEPVNQHIDAQE